MNDPRILHYECHQEEEARPYNDHTWLEFLKKSDIETPDRLQGDA
jgi:hypothetical protein